MISFRLLSRRLRLAVAAPWCLLAALAVVAATPATRALLLDSNNKPTAALNLNSANVTLPALAPLLSGGAGTLDLSGYNVGLPQAGVTAALAGAAINPGSVGATARGTGAFTNLDASNDAHVSGYVFVGGNYDEIINSGGAGCLYLASYLGVGLGDTSNRMFARFSSAGISLYGDLHCSAGVFDGAGNEVLDPSGNLTVHGTLTAGAALHSSTVLFAQGNGLVLYTVESNAPKRVLVHDDNTVSVVSY